MIFRCAIWFILLHVSTAAVKLDGMQFLVTKEGNIRLFLLKTDKNNPAKNKYHLARGKIGSITMSGIPADFITKLLKNEMKLEIVTELNGQTQIPSISAKYVDKLNKDSLIINNYVLPHKAFSLFCDYGLKDISGMTDKTKQILVYLNCFDKKDKDPILRKTNNKKNNKRANKKSKSKLKLSEEISTDKNSQEYDDVPIVENENEIEISGFERKVLFTDPQSPINYAKKNRLHDTLSYQDSENKQSPNNNAEIFGTKYTRNIDFDDFQESDYEYDPRDFESPEKKTNSKKNLGSNLNIETGFPQILFNDPKSPDSSELRSKKHRLFSPSPDFRNYISRKPAIFRQPNPKAVYVGLKNLGNTCYFNTLIQNLFMTTEFRKKILTLKTIDLTSKTDVENTLKYSMETLENLQNLFKNLNQLGSSAVSAQTFLHGIKNEDGSRNDLFSQQDMSEYFLFLMEYLRPAIRYIQKNESLNAEKIKSRSKSNESIKKGTSQVLIKKTEVKSPISSPKSSKKSINFDKFVSELDLLSFNLQDEYIISDFLENIFEGSVTFTIKADDFYNEAGIEESLGPITIISSYRDLYTALTNRFHYSIELDYLPDVY